MMSNERTFVLSRSSSQLTELSPVQTISQGVYIP
jgi:hypothetical protein